MCYINHFMSNMRKKKTPLKSDAAVPSPSSSGKGQKLVRKVSRSARKKKRFCPLFGVCVYKVLKQLHPKMNISYKSMLIMNQLMSDMFERLSSEASQLLHYCNMTTLSDRDIESAVKLVIPGELAKHAITEGSKAILKYTTSRY